MSTFTTPIQHSIGRPSHRNHTIKRDKRHPNCKGGSKLSLFADEIIVYIENSIDSTKKLLNLINQFGKTAGYKVKTQKSKAFLCTNSEISGTDIRGKKSHLI